MRVWWSCRSLITNTLAYQGPNRFTWLTSDRSTPLAQPCKRWRRPRRAGGVPPGAQGLWARALFRKIARYRAPDPRSCPVGEGNPRARCRFGGAGCAPRACTRSGGCCPGARACEAIRVPGAPLEEHWVSEADFPLDLAGCILGKRSI